MVDPTPGYPGHAKAGATAKVESKVWWGTAGFYLAGVVGLALVNAFTADDNALLLAALPDWLETIVLPLVPGAVGFITGWLAKHTPRPDLGQG